MPLTHASTTATVLARPVFREVLTPYETAALDMRSEAMTEKDKEMLDTKSYVRCAAVQPTKSACAQPFFIGSAADLGDDHHPWLRCRRYKKHGGRWDVVPEPDGTRVRWRKWVDNGALQRAHTAAARCWPSALRLCVLWVCCVAQAARMAFVTSAGTGC